MALSHGGYNFEALDTHGDVVPDGPHELRDQRAHFFAVVGESEIRDETGGRNLACEATLRGYASKAALDTAFNTLNSKANQLTGTLTVTGNVATTFGRCTFKGAAREKVIHDAVDGNYLCRIVLIWRQHQRD